MMSCPAGGSRPIRSRVAFVLFQAQFDPKRGLVHRARDQLPLTMVNFLPVTSRPEAKFPRIIGEHRTKAPCPRREDDRRHSA